MPVQPRRGAADRQKGPRRVPQGRPDDRSCRACRPIRCVRLGAASRIVRLQEGGAAGPPPDRPKTWRRAAHVVAAAPGSERCAAPGVGSPGNLRPTAMEAGAPLRYSCPPTVFPLGEVRSPPSDSYSVGPSNDRHRAVAVLMIRTVRQTCRNPGHIGLQSRCPGVTTARDPEWRRSARREASIRCTPGSASGGNVSSSNPGRWKQGVVRVSCSARPRHCPGEREPTH